MALTEKEFKLYTGEEKTIEKVILDENLHYLHMVLPEGEELPEHNTNSVVYMTVIRGKLSIGLDNREARECEAGTVLKIPYDTKMKVRNTHTQTLELIVVKSPAPKN